MNSIRSFILPVVAIIVMLIVVVRVDTLAVSDESIKKGIEDKVANTLELKEAKVNVVVEGGNVILYGKVVLYIQKMLYEQIAWKTVGIVEVDNEIRVVPQLPQTDATIERKIMEIVHIHPKFQTTGLKVAVEDGTVSIAGTFEQPRDVLFLKHRVAEIEGVVAIDLQAGLRI